MGIKDREVIRTSDKMIFWSVKRSWNDKIVEMMKQQTVQTMQTFILSPTMEILALTTVIIILIYIIKQIWQRRQGYQAVMDKKEEGKTINIAYNITTTLNTTWEIVNVKMTHHYDTS